MCESTNLPRSAVTTGAVTAASGVAEVTIGRRERIKRSSWLLDGKSASWLFDTTGPDGWWDQALCDGSQEIGEQYEVTIGDSDYDCIFLVGEDTIQSGYATDGGENTEELLNPNHPDDQELLALVTQRTRWIILQYILAHPQGMPSLSEITYHYPERDQSTIQRHLEKLVDHGVVEKVEVEREDRDPSLPRTFYRLSEKGESLIEEHNLVRADKERLRAAYAQAPKTDRIKRYEEADRPNPPSDGVDPDQIDAIREVVQEIDDSASNEEIAEILAAAMETENDPIDRKDEPVDSAVNDGSASSRIIPDIVVAMLSPVLVLLRKILDSFDPTDDPGQTGNFRSQSGKEADSSENASQNDGSESDSDRSKEPIIR